MKPAGCFVVILWGMVVSASLAAAEPRTDAWPVDTPQVPVRIRTLLEDRNYLAAVKAIDEARWPKKLLWITWRISRAGRCTWLSGTTRPWRRWTWWTKSIPRAVGHAGRGLPRGWLWHARATSAVLN